MKSSLALKASGLLVLCGTLLGATYATSVVTDITTVCAKVGLDYSSRINSLKIIPYLNNAPLSSDLWHGYNDGCVSFDTDWFMGAAQPGTSFSVQGLDSKGFLNVIENRDKVMLGNLKGITNVTLYYDIIPLNSIKGLPVVGSVSKEIRISNNGTLNSTYKATGTYKSDLDMTDSFDVMKQIGATKYTKLADFHANDNITRQQAAKFFLMTWHALHTGGTIPTPLSEKCKFVDEAIMDRTLIDAVHDVCSLGIMKGGAGIFNPDATITLGEVTTILMRMQYSTMNESVTPWYRSYMEKAFDVRLFDGFAYNPDMFKDGDKPLSRGMIGFMIRRLLQINNVPITTYKGI